MRIITLVFLLLSAILYGQNFWGRTIDLNTNTTIRGLSVVDNKIVWVGGSNGWIGRSVDGGTHWQLIQVPGFEKAEFRSIYAFDAQKVVIANTGSPANILITLDGGKSWSIVFVENDTAAFFDGMDFWNDNEGMIYGDPINGSMLLLSTIDGGAHWSALPDSCRPKLAKNEASFAASGTGIRCVENKKVIIATGGSVSRLFSSSNKGMTWDTIPTPMIHGSSTTGIFSVAYQNARNMIVVGGDFLIDSLKYNHIFYTNDGGLQWLAPEIPTRGYRECVEYITKKTIIATGPFGTDISYDEGKHWKALSDEKTFHVIRKARKGKLIIATGKGKISILR